MESVKRDTTDYVMEATAEYSKDDMDIGNRVFDSLLVGMARRAQDEQEDEFVERWRDAIARLYYFARTSGGKGGAE